MFDLCSMPALPMLTPCAGVMLSSCRQQVALTLIAQEDRRGIPSKHAHSSSHSSGSSSGSSSCSEAVLQEGSTNDGSTISRSMLVDKLGLPAVLGGVDMHDLLWARSVTLEAFMEWWGAYVGTVSAALLACHEADICGRAQLCEAETKLSVTIVHGLSRLGAYF